MNVVLDLPYTVCIWISAAVVIIYTLLGGLYSVAYTDVIQLIFIFFSLVSLFFFEVCHLQKSFESFGCVISSLFIPTVALCSLCSDESLHLGH